MNNKPEQTDEQKAVGKTAMARIETRSAGSGLLIPVKIAGYRYAYGRLEYFLEPIGGAGTIWLNSNKVTINP